MSGAGFIAGVAERLRLEQARVHSALRTIGPGGWGRTLEGPARLALLDTGHFPEYGAELDWTPREVAGHLRDSARIFTARIRALQEGPEPVLADFVTDEPHRIADYRTRALPALLAELAAAQSGLVHAVTTLTPGQLHRRGRHEVDGDVELGDVLAFLPGHQRDHAAQLVELTRLPVARG